MPKSDARDRNSSPSTVDSSDGGHSGRLVQPAMDMLYYSSHIAAVCESVNAEAKGSVQNTDLSKVEKRRETNRLSARRSRKRRRDEIEQLEEQLRRLAAETEELTAEKRKLQQELQEERLKAAAEIATPQVREQAPFANLGFAGRPQYDTSTQVLFQQQLQNLIVGGNNLRPGYAPQALAQGAPFSQPSLAPIMFLGMNSQPGFPSNSPLLATGLLGQNQSMERALLTLLQNNARAQVVQQPAATAPSWRTGIQSHAMNSLPSSSQQQTHDQATLKLLQALSALSAASSLSATPPNNVSHLLGQPLLDTSQPDAAASSPQFDVNELVTRGEHASQAQATGETHNFDNQTTQDDPTSYEV